MNLCVFCKNKVDESEPKIFFKGECVCSSCYIEMIQTIYEMSGYGDGGLIHLVFKTCLSSSHNKKRRQQVPQYKKTLKLLLKKYNFKCVICGSDKNLTIDHIKPVAAGGTDNITNLQILCKSCNSSKGAKWDG